MKKIIILFFVLSFGFVSCVTDELLVPQETEHTLFMYMPWSTNLTQFFKQNITDFESALKNNPSLTNNRLIVFFSSSATEATMFELKYKNGNIVRNTLKKYINPAFTTANGITSIINDVKYFAPAKYYSMIVSSHGMGWLPVDNERSRALGKDYEKYHWEYDGVPVTRFFGGTTPDVQTEVSVLATGIANAEIKMNYIMFDDCYMSSIEVAYDLKEVTDYLIACPTEIMAYGFPYHIVGKYLIEGTNLQSICEEFYNFYSTYEHPYGTIAVTITAELDNLAVLMKEINRKFLLDTSLLNNIQRMDGYSPVIFFDMGDYVSKLCTDTTLLNRFTHQFDRTVPPDLSLHTPSYYSMSMGTVPVNTFSGVTISDPSTNNKAGKKAETAWYKATH
ncbi:MAG: Clostripain family protein [Bacteroidales bacterium]|jgi:hypothetical protein|nr:Clostripain family protein [Bacteroidales bacterium]